MANRARDLVATPGHLRRRQRLLAHAVNRLGPDAATPPPTHDEIARRAYEIYQQRAGNQGDPEADWLEAERELLAASAVACEQQERSEARTTAGGAS
jgi:hypothetical protein